MLAGTAGSDSTGRGRQRLCDRRGARRGDLQRDHITIHAQSSTDTIDKMVDLALRGMPTTTYEQAKRMLKAFQVIVYLEDFKVKEITEIMGYDESKKDFIYRTVYRYGAGTEE